MKDKLVQLKKMAQRWLNLNKIPWGGHHILKGQYKESELTNDHKSKLCGTFTTGIILQ